MIWVQCFFELYPRISKLPTKLEIENLPPKNSDPTTQYLYQSGTNSRLYREDMMIWYSKDLGATWEEYLEVDKGDSGYSSLQVHVVKDGEVYLDFIYEQADDHHLVMDPDRFLYRRIGPLPGKTTDAGELKRDKVDNTTVEESVEIMYV